MVLGLHFLFFFFALGRGQIQISFQPKSSIFSKNRDGILVVSLPTGENATVCADRFTDTYANLACGDMGFPRRGISILAKNNRLEKSMKMVVIKCKGSETTLRDCEISTEGRYVTNCLSKYRVAHVFCLQKKIKVIAQKFTSQTQCNLNHDKVRLLELPGKKNTGFLQIRESSSHNFRFVCNKYFNFGLLQAKLFCSLLCNSPSKARPLMYLNPGALSVSDGYFKDMICPDYATSFDQCRQPFESTSCDPLFNVALRCGPEVIKPDPPPNVVCSNRSMVIEWAMDQTFHLNSTLVELHSNHSNECLYTKRDVANKVVIKIPLDYCHPVITDHERSIRFKYTIIRSYPNTGSVQFKTKESIDVYCEIPKMDEISKEYVHGDITYPPLLGTSFLKVVMTLHTDSEFEDLLPRPYDIEFYSPVYVKVTITNPLNQIKLSLTNCFVTSVKTFGEINPLNSAKIIDEGCPKEDYNVLIVPITKWSIAFQFTSFKLVESNQASVNIFCETMKCMIEDDPDCGTCKARSRRQKRSAKENRPSIIKVGPIVLH